MVNTNIELDKYNEILQDVISEIKITRSTVACQVNTSIIQMHWNIGKRLSIEGLAKGYGGNVVAQLSSDLKEEFPDSKGFSPRNLWDMKRFYEFYSSETQKLRQSVAVSPDAQKLPQVAAVLPWGHHLQILSKIKDRTEAIFYITSAVEMGWTRDVLLNFIKADAYHAQALPKHHNFKTTLPEQLQQQADDMLKNTYNLGFLGVMQPIKELELEKRIVEKIKFFLLELGAGFAFIGNQYRVLFNDREYFVDLLLYNRKIQALVAIDLKIGSFKPDFIGKMNYYLGILDDQVRMSGENPSIGIVLCAEKDHVDVEMALRDVNKPIGVADYSLQFPKDELKALIRKEIQENLKDDND
ncbi:MAG: PDDEXK nuclease domain-containing protein [Clostridiales Family XIII bacterium]|jgi:predicted nuclease of restriction endonuclease-like (RecB) superfamily|nr:PDDEXK nuclease domain-containing protein [Clostridiales Family XIII bacterium]